MAAHSPLLHSFNPFHMEYPAPTPYFTPSTPNPDLLDLMLDDHLYPSSLPSEPLLTIAPLPFSTLSNLSTLSTLALSNELEKEERKRGNAIDLSSGNPRDFAPTLMDEGERNEREEMMMMEERDNEETENEEREEEAGALKSIQLEMFRHHMLYLQQIEQIIGSPASSPPSSPESSPRKQKDNSTPKKRKLTPAFKVDHYKLRMSPNTLRKKLKRDASESSLSVPSSPDSLSDSPCPSPCASPTTKRSLSVDAYTHTALISSLPSPTGSPSDSPFASMLPASCLDEMRSAAACATILALTKRPELLTLKQSDAAKILGISTSVLSKRWREATKGKKWPHRVHHKLKRSALSA